MCARTILLNNEHSTTTKYQPSESKRQPSRTADGLGLTLIAPMPNKLAPVTKHATKNKSAGDESGLINGTMTYLRAQNTKLHAESVDGDIFINTQHRWGQQQ